MKVTYTLNDKVLVPKLFKTKNLAVTCAAHSIAAGKTTDLMIHIGQVTPIIFPDLFQSW